MLNIRTKADFWGKLKTPTQSWPTRLRLILVTVGLLPPRPSASFAGKRTVSSVQLP